MKSEWAEHIEIDNCKVCSYFNGLGCDFAGEEECYALKKAKIKANKKETVNHPSHYNQGIEAIEIIESWDLNFSLGNAIKYILRAPHKSNTLEDLKKAEWYIKREIERIEKLANIEQ